MVRVLGCDEVRRLVGMADAIAAVREALAAADRGGAVMPAPFGMRLPDAGGEMHVKGAYLTGAPVLAVKTATGFYRNAGRGLAVSGGMTMVHDAMTGTLRMLIADGGLLTDLRTAAAGAVAAHLLARPGARSAAVIGTGGQARYQLLALLKVRPIEQVTVWGRRRQAAEQYRLTVADLTGPGIQDAAVAALAARLAGEHGAGRDVPLGDW